MLQPSFLALFLSSDNYGRRMLMQLTIFTMTVHFSFIPHRFIRNWLLHVLANDGVSVGCLVFSSPVRSTRRAIAVTLVIRVPVTLRQILYASFSKVHISTATHQKVFIFGPQVSWRAGFYSMIPDPRVDDPGWGYRSKSRTPLKSVFLLFCYENNLGR